MEREAGDKKKLLEFIVQQEEKFKKKCKEMEAKFQVAYRNVEDGLTLEEADVVFLKEIVLIIDDGTLPTVENAKTLDVVEQKATPLTDAKPGDVALKTKPAKSEKKGKKRKLIHDENVLTGRQQSLQVKNWLNEISSTNVYKNLLEKVIAATTMVFVVLIQAMENPAGVLPVTVEQVEECLDSLKESRNLPRTITSVTEMDDTQDTFTHLVNVIENSVTTVLFLLI